MNQDWRGVRTPNNIAGLLASSSANTGLVIEYPSLNRQCRIMSRLILTLALSLFAAQASAACYADYKAKRDAPLRLHYGVAEIRGDCASGAAANELRPRLEAAGWELLNVVSVFEDDGLEEREESAGDFYLRF